jgi:hypothetical protein
MIYFPILAINLQCFGFLYYTTRQTFISRANSLQEALGSKTGMEILNHKHAGSSIAILLVMILHFNFDRSLLNYFEFDTHHIPASFIILFVLVLLLSMAFPVKPGNAESLPVLTRYYLYRTLYLVLYEVYFRLTLVMSIGFYTGVPVAIIISTLFYVLIHRFSRKAEFYSSFVFGLILGWMMYSSYSIVPCIILHLLLSLPYELKIVLTPKNSKL